ncbi:Sister chromatid cohesion protein DCC1 [Madurella fahalii]|uniref:Sister chromatid cohesion protein DCC1 n=1 Tax=Madurella fahalii TaxID=1157608 RepID=A0ABQ0GPE0_9PEZI
MSSQDNAGIPLSHAADGTGYKLLELPPELLELLESQDPPTLTLHPSPTAALLKAPSGDGSSSSSKTYSLRQKNTSNALYLLAPAITAAPTTDDEDASMQGVGVSGLHAIATVHETIELIPEASGGGEAAAAPKARGKWHEKFGRGR